MAKPPMQQTLFLLGPGQVELRRHKVPEPRPGELLVAIRAATTCGTDLKVFKRGGHPRMLVVPTPFGHEMSGVVVHAGDGVEAWKPNDEVIVSNSAPCGVCDFCARARENLCRDLHYLNGAFSEYVIVPRRFVARSVHRKPQGLPFEIAALSEPLACVVHGLEAASLPPRSDALVIGGGPIGLLFVAMLAAEGHSVTLADPHESRLDTGKALGASQTFAARRDGHDTQRLRVLGGSGEGFDAVIEATGSPAAWETGIGVVRTGGSVLLFGGCAQGTSVALDTHLAHYSELTLRGAYHHRPATFARAVDLLARGVFDARLLITNRCNLGGVEGALRSMDRREALKFAVMPSCPVR
ncbi:MAG: alcohol dehydrogenase catalytic domain-containing protein [Acidobacteria bacterium]|nr:alcohol dehydrogenase catalytic domain-containing protein [Acidobacteriota bacterium]